jgi:beta-N-acetylhexosaminidase
MARDVRPFAAAVARAPAMQMSAAVYVAWDGVTPATLLPDAVRLLRERLGFRGAIVSADLVAAQAATGESIGRGAIQAFMAGCDMLLISGGREEQETAYRAILNAARRGRIPRSRIQESVRRVAALRTAAG